MFQVIAISFIILHLSQGYVPYLETTVTIERVTDPIDHGEGPHWDPKRQALYYVNTFNPAVLQLKDGILTYQTIDNTDSIGTVTPFSNTESKFLLTCDTKLWVLDWDGVNNNSGIVNYRTPLIRDLEPTKPKNQVNDGKADTQGRLWLGTLTRNPDTSVTVRGGSLFIVHDDGSVKTLLENVCISNGLAWNRDNTKFFFIDSTNRSVVVFDYNSEEETLDNMRELFTLSDYPNYASNVIPDGMTIDSNDNLWVALYRGGAVVNVDSVTGDVISLIEMPVSGVTSVAFGGENLDILYVTTSRHDLNETEQEQQPYAGSTFAVQGLGVTGTYMNDYTYEGNLQL